jgi:glycosyltransferase involved in cell wall biosynthesis
MRSDIPVTAGILTFNSVNDLKGAFDSVRAFDEVLICDGGSTDGTRELAASLGCTVIDQDAKFKDSLNRLTDIAGARDQMVKAAKHDWILFIDSDELATPELVTEIGSIATAPRTCGAYRVPRLFTLDDEIITCAMVYPSYQTRLVHKDALSHYDGLVHDAPVLLLNEEVGSLEAAQLVPQPPFRELWAKWRSYLRLEEVKKADVSRARWIDEFFRPQVKSIKWLTYRYLRSLKRCRGSRLPARYELGRLAYECLVIWYTGRRFIGLGKADLDTAWG